MRLSCMPSFDDELKSHLSDQAEAIGVDPVGLAEVQRIGRRHSRRRRAFGVVGAMALVVGAAVGVRPLFSDDGSTLDVAADVAPVANASTTTAPAPAGNLSKADQTSAQTSFAMEEGGLAYGYGGGVWTVPWGDGFLMLGTVWEPAPLPDSQTFDDSMFPAEIVDAVKASGATTLDGAIRALEDVGLLQQAMDLVSSDPELLDFYTSLQGGGTTRFVAQVSADGLNWNDIPGFTLPVADAQIDRVVSDGTHLVVSQRADAQWGALTLERGVAIDAGTDSGQASLTVSVTRNLTDWQTFELSPPPSDVPTYVSVDHWLGGLAANSAGWLATVQTSTYPDFWSLLPSDVRDGDQIFDFKPTAEGLEVTFYESGFGVDPGVVPVAADADASTTVQAPTDVVEAVPVPAYPVIGPDMVEPNFVEPSITDTQLYTWEELGIDPVEVQQYVGRPGEYDFGQAETTAWIGSWGTQPMSTPLAGTSGEGIEQIVGTDDGFVAQKYEPYSGGSSLVFSPDGIVWSPVDAPSSRWFGGLVAVEDGVLLSTNDESGPRWWIGSADGSTWAQAQLPDFGGDLGQGIYFDTNNIGAVAVVDIHQYQSVSEPPVEFDVEVKVDGKLLHLFAHADGTADLTVTDAATGELVAEVNGSFDGFSADFAVLEGDAVTIVDPDGNKIVDLPLSVVMDTVLPARQAALDASGWAPPSPVEELPELVLIASSDGINWMTTPLEGSEYPSAMAVNGNLVAVQTSSGWQTFNIS